MANQSDYAQLLMPYQDYDFTIASIPTSELNPLPGQLSYAPYREGSQALQTHQRSPGVPARRPIDPTNRGLLSQQGVYNSFAGTDIVAQFVPPNEEPLTLGELQTVSYSMHRENTPVRFVGHTSPVGFVKGPRTIAGSLIFTVFNNYAFYRLRQFQEAIGHRLYPVADMLPPFDIVITFANEMGVFSKLKIFGVTIVDEGGTMSIDDLITEQTFSYLARGIQPMTGFYIEGPPQ